MNPVKRVFLQAVEAITGVSALAKILGNLESKKQEVPVTPSEFIEAVQPNPCSVYNSCQADQYWGLSTSSAYKPSQNSFRDPDRDPDPGHWSFDDYQLEALKTAQCPVIGHPIIYSILGIFGEMGEVLEKIQHCINNNMSGVWNYPSRGEIIKEVGDVLWYVAVAAHELDMKLSAVVGMEKGDDDMTTFSMMAAVTDKCESSYDATILTSDDLGKKLTQLLIYQGILAERVKKVFRDGDWKFEGERKEQIVYMLGYVVEWIARLCNVIHLDMATIAKGNIDKLIDRRERNVIQGEGDNR